MEWSPQQDGALKAVKKWVRARSAPQVFRLFGYAGTGKTTMAIEVRNMVKRCFFASFTGKAALVMRRKGCYGARTIHSMIYTPIEGDGGEHHFELNQDAEVGHADVVVIDEVSMVNSELGKDLLSFGVKVLVLGDPAQLPPIEGAGYFTTQEPDTMLTEIHRQAADNPIVAMATAVREGRKLAVGEYGQSRVIARSEMTSEMLTGANQIIVGTHITRRGVNTRMRKLRFGSLATVDAIPDTPMAGDRLVCLRNNRKRGFLNGSLWDTAEVTKPHKRDHNVTRAEVDSADEEGIETKKIAVPNEFFGGDVESVKAIPWAKRKLLDEFDFGYALTCHKSQGSQWDDVLILNQADVFRENANRWLYTAVTRAAERVMVVEPSGRS